MLLLGARHRAVEAGELRLRLRGALAAEQTEALQTDIAETDRKIAALTEQFTASSAVAEGINRRLAEAGAQGFTLRPDTERCAYQVVRPDGSIAAGLSEGEQKEREAQRQELVDDLYVGMVVTGTVTRLVEFGVFVELGGAEGLIQLKEISWTRDVKPEDVVKVGDKVDVLIKELDWDRNRISLSLRGAQGDPWNDAVAKFPQGTAFTGKVTHIEPFGAFVELIPGVEGLIPVSRLGRGRRLASPKEVLNIGDAILVEVDSVDLDRHRFSLKPVDERLKALKPGAIEPGAKMEGLVESVQAFGVFVRLSEEKTGLLHASETGIPKGTAQFGKMEHQFPVDSKIEVVVKSVDGDRISLTLPAEWEKQQQADEANHDVSTWLNDQKEASGAFGSLAASLTA